MSDIPEIDISTLKRIANTKNVPDNQCDWGGWLHCILDREHDGGHTTSGKIQLQYMWKQIRHA